MKPQKITLEQVLRARERRAMIQNEMLSRHESACLVCLTLNIAGEIKRTPMTRMLFKRGIAELEATGADILDSLIIDEATGSEAFWLLDADAKEIKKELEAVEDSFPAARLFDFDVLVSNGQGGIKKLSREISRKCLICGKPAAECARSRNHGLDAIRAATDGLLTEFCAETLADAAHSALLYELYTTPKPGLVDLANCGAHKDMDVPLFEKSADSLRTSFHDAAMLGMKGCSMEELRTRGLIAEQDMFKATGGVNTHKGMIYSMGLILAGMGMALREGYDDFLVATKYAAQLAGQDAEAHIGESLADPKTNGANVLRTYGARGALGEAAAGFPDAVFCASRLQYYMKMDDSGCSCAGEAAVNKAGALAFCDSMARLEDTNLLHRGGQEGLDFVRTEASRIASIDDPGKRIRELEKLDIEMINRNLSPGGSADMLALGYLLLRWRDM